MGNRLVYKKWVFIALVTQRLECEIADLKVPGSSPGRRFAFWHYFRAKFLEPEKDLVKRRILNYR